MAGEGGGKTRDLDQTATWAVASVCAVIIIISISLEKSLSKLGIWLTEKHKKALYEALDKVKTELMILGFISLLLVFSQGYVAQICVPARVANSMLPCPALGENDEKDAQHHQYKPRTLAVSDSKPSCKELDAIFDSSKNIPQAVFFAVWTLIIVILIHKGYLQLISVDGLHQLHILIFFLAFFHVIYSAVTMTLGKLKIRSWKEWEQETSSHDHKLSNDTSRVRLTRETTFVRTHSQFWTKTPSFFYIGCFLRQFFRSVSGSDYLTLRHGFIAAHLSPGSKFNFQKYIKRSLEDDFKSVVGVSPALWASFVVFLLLNVNGWKALIWGSVIPVVVILAVGTKLQVILTRMAAKITEEHAVVQGIPLVVGSDELFWFSSPRLVLHLIHFALFQNSFQIIYSLWLLYEFRSSSCFHHSPTSVVIKPALGVVMLVLCSYITLPLYALITQMGSHMKKTIFDEQTSNALKKWHESVKKKKGGLKSRIRSLEDGSVGASALESTQSLPHRIKSTSHSSPSYKDYDEALENDDPSVSITMQDNLLVKVDHHHSKNASQTISNDQEMRNKDDLSFS